jgi:hypothetical protein
MILPVVRVSFKKALIQYLVASKDLIKASLNVFQPPLGSGNHRDKLNQIG